MAGIGDASARALAKLEQVLPTRLRRRLNSLRSAIVRLADSGPTVELGAVSFLAGACSERSELRFVYRDHAGAASSRTVEPHRIVHTGRRWYLVAWDRDRDDWRTFRIDRLSEPVATGAHFTQRSSPDDDVGAYVSRGVASSAYKVRARVLLRAPLEAVQGQISPSSGHLEAIDDSTCMLHVGAGSLDMLVVWLAAIGVDFDVREPPELFERLSRVTERLSRVVARFE